MNNVIRIYFLNFFRVFFYELSYINNEDILSVGTFKFIFQFLFSKIIGRKGLFSLVPIETKIICFDNIKIKGELSNSRLIRSLISSRLYIQAINEVFIHSSVLIGPDVKIISANHNNYNYEIWDKNDPIILNKNVWIGANSVILPGVNLGMNCIVGAGSVVTKSFDRDSIIGGNPAKLIRKK